MIFTVVFEIGYESRRENDYFEIKIIRYELDMRNPKLTILFSPEELEVLEELEQYYKIQTSDLIKAALEYVNKKKPVLKNVSGLTEKMDVATTIFTKIMNCNMRYGNKRSNIFVTEKLATCFVCRSYSYGESEIIKISKSRWQIIQKIKKDTDFCIRIMLAYKCWSELSYQLVIFDLNEIPLELYKAGKNGEVYFYTNKIEMHPEYFKKTRELLGENRYNEILNVLNQSVEGEI